MAYGQWEINIDRTIKEFGYHPEELTSGSTKPVKCVCKMCGIVSNKRLREANRKHVCKSIINGKKRCFKCKTFKDIEEFSKNRSTYDGYQKVCKECFANYESVKLGYEKKSTNLKTNLKVYLRNKTSGLNCKCKLKNLPFNLNKEYLYIESKTHSSLLRGWDVNDKDSN